MDKYIVNYNITEIDFNTILPIWKNELWPGRVSPIESHSAMMITPGTYDIGNFKLPLWCYGYFVGDKLIGVNSGHLCTDGSARSRGLWVNPEYRGNGYGKILLQATLDCARQHSAIIVWSYPRKTSWPAYVSVGFMQITDWQISETSDSNAYCYTRLS